MTYCYFRGRGGRNSLEILKIKKGKESVKITETQSILPWNPEEGKLGSKLKKEKGIAWAVGLLGDFTKGRKKTHPGLNPVKGGGGDFTATLPAFSQ